MPTALSAYPIRVITDVLGHDSSNLVGRMAVREVLTADRNYFVNTSTGSDSNTGLSSGAAFLTIQHGINVATALDPSIYNVTVNVTGNSTEEIVLGGFIPTAASYTLVGDSTTPSNCTITNAFGFQIYAPCTWTIGGFKLVATTFALFVNGPGANINVSGNIEFGVGGTYHCFVAGTGANLTISTPYIVSGNAGGAHMFAANGGSISCSNQTVTLNGTLTIGTFVIAADCSAILLQGNTYTITGSVSGQRYSASGNGVIDTLGAGATYLPGSVAGSTASGGQYV